jgi:Mg2+ and Co2+ transporter CorA
MVMAGDPANSPSESLLFVPDPDPKKDSREAIDSILSDRFMAFLSILLIPIILLPLFVSLSDTDLSFLEICDATIILFFVVEYATKLYLAKVRWDYFKSPWHILDLVVIALSFVSYVPLVGLSGKGSAVLLARLLRLPRALTVAGRTAGGRIGKEEVEHDVETKQPDTIIRRVGADLSTVENDLTWEDLNKRLTDGKQEWLDIYNVTPEGIAKLSRMLQVAEPHFKTGVVDDIYPHVSYVQQLSFIFLQSGQIVYPKLPEHYLKIARSGVILICFGPKIISVSPHGNDLFKKVLESRRDRHAENSFSFSVLYGILESMLSGYRSILVDIETEVGKLGNIPRSRLPKDFLTRVYELNKEVSKLVSNIVHFKGMLSIATSKRLPLEGFDEKAEDDFQVLMGEAQMLNELADDLSDNLQSIIDLYINQEAFETNRVLKILAVITSLAIIPAAVSGILGENLLGTPFNAQLWQVILGMSIAMVFALYCFIKVGWLKA